MLREAVLDKFTLLPAELKSVMLDNFIVNGAIPLTLTDMKALLTDALGQMRAEMRDAICTAAASTTQPTPLASGADDPRFHLWPWKDGALHMVPEGWLLPVVDVKATWHLWHFGHVLDKVRPLRHLKKADLRDGKQVTQWSKTNGVVAAVAKVIVEMKLAESAAEVVRMTAEQSTAAFDAAILRLMERVRVGSTQRRCRWMDMSVATLYNHLSTEKKRRREELQVEVGGEEGRVEAAAAVSEGEREGEERAAQRRRVE